MKRHTPQRKTKSALPKPDGARCHAAILRRLDAAHALRKTSPQKALRETERGLVLAQEAHQPELICRWLAFRSLLYQDALRFQEAQSDLKQARDILPAGFTALHVELLKQTGNVYQFTQEFKSALQAYQSALDMMPHPETGEEKKQHAALLNNLGGVYHKLGMIDLALTHYRQSLDLKLSLGNTEGILYSQNNIGALFQEVGRYAEGEAMLREAHDLLLTYNAGLNTGSNTGSNTHSVKHPIGAAIFGGLANIYLEQGKLIEALSFGLKSIAYRQALDDPRNASYGYNLVASCYMQLGDDIAALGYLKEALRFAESAGNKEQIAGALRQMARIQLQLGNYPTALDVAFQTLKLCEDINYKNGQGESLEVIGNCYQHLGSLADALKYHLRARMIRKEVYDVTGEAAALRSLGMIYNTLGDGDVALVFLNQSLELETGIDNRVGITRANMAIATVYLALKKPSAAADHSDRALQMARQINSKRLLAESCRLSVDVLKRIGRAAESNAYHAEYLSLRNELFSTEKQQRILQALLELEMEKIRRETEPVMIDAQIMSAISKARQISAATLPDRSAPVTSSSRRQTKKVPLVRVTTFGKFAVFIRGKEVQPEDWSRKKARDVFKFLLLHHGQYVSSDRLIDALWNETDFTSAEGLLATAISHARKALALYAPKQTFIKTGESRYMLDLQETAEIDFIEFRSRLAAARRETDSTAHHALLESAVSLYHGEFLSEDAFAEWASYERESLTAACLDALHTLAQAALESKRYDAAITWAKQALMHDAIDEPAYTILFTALREKGATLDLQKEVQRAQAAFERELNTTLPKPFLKFLS
jgi:two-component SAPR family response regulator